MARLLEVLDAVILACYVSLVAAVGSLLGGVGEPPRRCNDGESPCPPRPPAPPRSSRRSVQSAPRSRRRRGTDLRRHSSSLARARSVTIAPASAADRMPDRLTLRPVALLRLAIFGDGGSARFARRAIASTLAPTSSADLGDLHGGVGRGPAEGDLRPARRSARPGSSWSVPRPDGGVIVVERAVGAACPTPAGRRSVPGRCTPLQYGRRPECTRGAAELHQRESGERDYDG